VLQATAMPSVLVETGFISNPEEEKYLNSKEGQDELANCMLKALKKYIKWLEDKQEGDGKDDKTNTNNPASSEQNTQAFLDMIERKEKAVRAK
jgi:N-acetylmuramoyl-L-alanine amidase